MDNKFIATIYQKVFLNENILVFRRVGVVKDLMIDFNNSREEAVIYDGEGKRILFESMEDEYTFVSDDSYCYGYPITMQVLKETYPNCVDESELLKKYFEEISEVVNIGYFDTEQDRVKILVTNEKMLKEHESDELFDNFRNIY